MQKRMPLPANSDPLALFVSVEWAGAIEGSVVEEHWVLHSPFVIARGSEDVARVIVVTLRMGDHVGRGEACPVTHYGETVEGVLGLAEAMLDELRWGWCWQQLHDRYPPGAARNAVDCAMWDLLGQVAGKSVCELLGRPAPRPVETVYTLSIGSPLAMAQAARNASGHSRLKLKLAGDGRDGDRLIAVRAAAPDTVLIADVNEYWSVEMLHEMLPVVAETGMAMLEQPLPAGRDDVLNGFQSPVPLGADESVHVSTDLEGLPDGYGVVNIKLDKTGGLTEALRLHAAAKMRGLDTMVGCMLGTSLAMAPAHLLAQDCAYVDLDAPLLIGADRENAMTYRAGWIDPPSARLWGGG